VVINQVLAGMLWPGEDPIGRTIMDGVGEDVFERQVVGVVGQERCTNLLGDAEPCSWVPLRTAGAAYVRIRTSGDAMAFVPSLRAIVGDLNRDAAVAVPATLQSYLDRLTEAERVSAGASSALAGFALVLVALGSVSLFLSMVNGSRREIAIRLAIGAGNATIATRVLSQGLVLTAVGVVGGLLAARWLADLVGSQLYETEPSDPATYIAVALLISLVAVTSVAYAARVATKTEPMRYLRSI
jgi:putative ABC transport system permease protein